MSKKELEDQLFDFLEQFCDTHKISESDTDVLLTRVFQSADQLQTAAYLTGHDDGAKVGYEEGHEARYDEGYEAGYDEGYKAGYNVGSNI